MTFRVEVSHVPDIAFASVHPSSVPLAALSRSTFDHVERFSQFRDGMVLTFANRQTVVTGVVSFVAYPMGQTL